MIEGTKMFCKGKIQGLVHDGVPAFGRQTFTTGRLLCKGIFNPTTLYVKIHCVTGTKYFGKTSRYHDWDDVHKYSGSGKWWTRHLKQHGKHYITVIIGYYTDRDECKRVALNFSIVNNIRESRDWANLIYENGLDGGWGTCKAGSNNPMFGKNHSELSIQRISDACKIHWNTVMGKRQQSEKRKGKTHTNETRKKISDGVKKAMYTEEVQAKLRRPRGPYRPRVRRKGNEERD